MKESRLACNIPMFICFLIITSTLIGCSGKAIAPLEPLTVTEKPTLAYEEENKNIEECIPPLETFAYSAKNDPNKPLPGKTFNVLPKQWQIENDVPQASDLSANPMDKILPTSLEVTRTKNSIVELWFRSKPYYSYREEDIKDNQFWVYMPAEQSWRTVPARVENSNIVVDKLFVTQSGEIWGQNFWYFRAITEDQPLFSRYNEETNSFMFVQGTEKIKALWHDDNYINSVWSEVLLDKHDVFWVFAHQDAIYSYSIQEKKIQVRAEIPDLFVAYPVIYSDDYIYFQDRYDQGSTTQEQKLYTFSIESGKVVWSYTTLEPWPTYTKLFVDRTGRMWFGSSGWREPDGEWFILQRPQIFTTNATYDIHQLRWAWPYIVAESSDGRLWFRSYNGMAWLDFEKQKWCWFTTYQSNIVEDSDHNLWMIADNKLYKLSLGAN